MKKIKMFSVAAAFGGILLATGCASTKPFDPSEGGPGIRDPRTISHEEMRLVAREAVADLLVSERFTEYLEKFKAENNGRRPVLKLAATVNGTNDPDLNTTIIDKMLERALFNSKKVDVSRVEGNDRIQGIADSRLIENDPNFKQDTVAQRGTLIAASLVMRPTVVSNTTRDGRISSHSRFFEVEVSQIKEGTLVWTFNKELGFVKTRGAVGW